MLKEAQRNALALQSHFVRTYLNLRRGIVLIGATLPFVLWLGDLVLDAQPLRPSMSDYYYSVMGDWFVGALVAIGAFLYLYKGFSTRENWALNVAGILAVVIAIVPMKAPKEIGADIRSTVHFASAVGFFLCIAYVCIRRAPDTLSEWLVPDPARRRTLQRTYTALGVAMVVLPLVSAVIARSWWKVAVEAAGVEVFAAYWWIKSRELQKTDADLLAVQGRLERSDEEATGTPGRLQVLA